MRTLFVIIYVAIAVPAAISTTENSKISNDLQLEASRNNGIIGIASIAGITSRNGRVSSIGGIKFFPGPGSMNEYFYPLEYKDYSYPFTVATEKDGRYASGTVHVNPGYISASAKAGFGSPRTESRIEYNPSNIGPQRSYNEFFFQPQPELISSRNAHNWFAKDFFQGFPSTPEVVRNGWRIPDFNPFMNFWR